MCNDGKIDGYDTATAYLYAPMTFLVWMDDQGVVKGTLTGSRIVTPGASDADYHAIELPSQVDTADVDVSLYHVDSDGNATPAEDLPPPDVDPAAADDSEVSE
jgi:hypothetical protein